MPLCSPAAAGSRRTRPRKSSKAPGPEIPCAAAYDWSCTIIFQASVRAFKPDFEQHSRQRRPCCKFKTDRPKKSLALGYRAYLAAESQEKHPTCASKVSSRSRSAFSRAARRASRADACCDLSSHSSRARAASLLSRSMACLDSSSSSWGDR